MKNSVNLLALLFILQLSSQGIVKHVAISDNIQGHITTVDDIQTNGKKDAILIVTQNYGAYNINEIGVWYSGGKWKIFNQNLKPIPENSKFNILVLPPKTSKAFVHTTISSNISNHITTLNNELTDDNPNALVYITQRFGKYNTANVGVWFNNGNWKIYNEDTSKEMPVGTQFNVLVLKSGRNIVGFSELYGFKYTNNSKGHISNVDSPVALARSATLFITQNWENVYNPNVTGVWHSGSNWTVYNQNRKTLPKDVQFNVLAANYKSIEVLEKPQVAIIAPGPPKSMIKLPEKVTLQNFNKKFSLNTVQKKFLNTHATQKTKILDFYTKNQTVNGKRFTELAIKAMANDQFVNVEEAFIETATFDSSNDWEAIEEMEETEDYIPIPIVLSTLDTVQIKFGITISDQMHANQKVSKILIEGITHAVELANGNLLDSDRIKSIYVMATTNGKHGSNSNHYHGAAADISRINDEKMALSGITYQIIQLQNAFDNYAYVRENFGPAMKHKYKIENDTWNYSHNVGGHDTHIHFSIRK